MTIDRGELADSTTVIDASTYIQKIDTLSKRKPSQEAIIEVKRKQIKTLEISIINGTATRSTYIQLQLSRAEIALDAFRKTKALAVQDEIERARSAIEFAEATRLAKADPITQSKDCDGTAIALTLTPRDSPDLDPIKNWH